MLLLKILLASAIGGAVGGPILIFLIMFVGCWIFSIYIRISKFFGYVGPMTASQSGTIAQTSTTSPDYLSKA